MNNVIIRGDTRGDMLLNYLTDQLIIPIGYYFYISLSINTEAPLKLNYFIFLKGKSKSLQHKR